MTYIETKTSTLQNTGLDVGPTTSNNWEKYGIVFIETDRYNNRLNYLSRKATKELIAELQTALDNAGPEPIKEPENIDGVYDCDNVKWNRREVDGLYDAEDGSAVSSFESLVTYYGPVTPFRNTETKLPPISQT